MNDDLMVRAIVDSSLCAFVAGAFVVFILLGRAIIGTRYADQARSDRAVRDRR